ncbi:MAG: HAD hydrolase family protein [Acidimicrobiales bacterium]
MSATLVITDLDGSFWGAALRCHPSTLAAVGELRSAGIPLLVATGRREGSTKRGLAGNGLSLPAVLLNGALGVDLPTATRFHAHPFAPEAAQQVIESLAEVGLSPVIYTDDGLVRSAPDVTTHADHLGGFGDDHRAVPPSTTAGRASILSFSMLGMERAVLEPAVAALADVAADVLLYEDHLYRAWSIHIQPPAITKWDGIRAYLRYADLRPDRIVAIGDAVNDLEMLANADLSIGVAGGQAEVLAAVDLVIPHPDDGGWRSVLDHL